VHKTLFEDAIETVASKTLRETVDSFFTKVESEETKESPTPSLLQHEEVSFEPLEFKYLSQDLLDLIVALP
jgi:hypothetical protein